VRAGTPQPSRFYDGEKSEASPRPAKTDCEGDVALDRFGATFYDFGASPIKLSLQVPLFQALDTPVAEGVEYLFHHVF
jgi:hypothetical protein